MEVERAGMCAHVCMARRSAVHVWCADQHTLALELLVEESTPVLDSISEKNCYVLKMKNAQEKMACMTNS